MLPLPLLSWAHAGLPSYSKVSPMKLIAFDGDHTLWTPLSGVNLSDRTPTDHIGRPDYSYKLVDGERLIAKRDDGPQFALRPEAREVLEELRKRGLLVGVISYNHEANVMSILEAFDLLLLIDYIVAEWHTNKDQMLGKMLSTARQDGHDVKPGDALLVDDDPHDIYRGQCSRMGAGFSCFGVDIRDLREVYDLLENTPKR